MSDNSNNPNERYVINPESHSTLENNDKDKKKFTTAQKALAAVAGGLAVVGIVTGSIVAGSAGKAPEKSPTDNSATPEETNTPTPEAPEMTVESLSLNPDLLADPDAFMNLLVEDRFTGWLNAGATPENARISLDEGVSRNTANRIAAEFDQKYIDALFIPDWQSNPVLVELVNKIIKQHSDTLQVYFITSHPDLNPDDKVPYRRESNHDSVISVTSNEDGSVTIQSTQFDTDNFDQNTVDEQGIGQVNGVPASPTLTFTIDNGSVKISNYIFG